MHKILKKTIKYGAAVLLTLIAVILTGIGYLYLSADMMTPQFASTPETDRVIRKDSLRQYGGNYLRHIFPQIPVEKDNEETEEFKITFRGDYLFYLVHKYFFLKIK